MCTTGRRVGHGLAVSGVALWLAACAPLPQERVLFEPTAAPEGFPSDLYEAGYAEGGDVYRIVPELSEIDIFVYRGGRLARMGHNHIVSSRDVQGYVFLVEEATGSRMDLFVTVDTLLVDDPELRAAAGEGFDTEPTEKDIDGTRSNMLGERVLDAGRYPFIVAGADVTGGRFPLLELTVELTIRDATMTLPTTASLEIVQVDRARLTVSGELAIRQTDFGITPYGVLGGALTVKDELELRYRLVAELLITEG